MCPGLTGPAPTNKNINDIWQNLPTSTTIYHLPASSQSSASNIKFIPRLPLCAGLEIDNFLLLMLLELMKGTFRNNDLQHIPHPDLPTHWDSQESNLTRNKCVLCALYCVLCPCFEVFLKFWNKSSCIARLAFHFSFLHAPHYQGQCAREFILNQSHTRYK